MNLFPLCTANVWPTKSGVIVQRRDHVAMNPVDHPMGGGEGKASGGHPRSRTGKYAKGEITRTRGKGSDKMIIQRRNGKKLPNK